jgi:6-pyruvoyltetrahydropterin/6-carboxytetrahydropterin synthase
MNRATRTFRAEMAHRLNGHEGKCQNLHGHSYVIHVTAESRSLDSLGRVIDFGELKSGIGQWIADKLDHGTMLQSGDPLLTPVRNDGSKLYEVPFPPTAENIATLVAAQAAALHPGVRIARVEVWETEHGMAAWEAG